MSKGNVDIKVLLSFVQIVKSVNLSMYVFSYFIKLEKCAIAINITQNGVEGSFWKPLSLEAGHALSTM